MVDSEPSPALAELTANLDHARRLVVGVCFTSLVADHGPGDVLAALDRVVEGWGVTDLGELRDGMRAFVEERDWGRFHDPKSVVLALVGEVGELAELVQWLPAADVRELARDEPLQTRLGEEMSDVLLYLVLLADVLDLDLAAAARSKLTANARKHPS